MEGGSSVGEKLVFEGDAIEHVVVTGTVVRKARGRVSVVTAILLHDYRL